VAGVWNEHGRRQYALFLNLRQGDQIGAHVSTHGGPTPGDAYSRDDAVGATKVTFETWHCAAISYDGTWTMAYLDSVLNVKAIRGQGGGNPFFYPGGFLKGDADFTVGAVTRPVTVTSDADGTQYEIGSITGNPFIGLLGSLTIYNLALSDEEIRQLALLD
jgi:hypothetical protein